MLMYKNIVDDFSFRKMFADEQRLGLGIYICGTPNGLKFLKRQEQKEQFNKTNTS